ncbi:MAG: PP2C family serine/threonine-protein phosphatase [Vicinamibacteraceae bacterium]
MPVQWAATTHPGIRRTSNEDAFCSRPDLGLFIVADGMGGHVAGEVASKIAVEAIEAFIGETANEDSALTWPQPIDPALGVDGSRLKSAFHLANRRLADEVAAAVDLRGMATTASTVLLKDDRKAMLAHVGDSRIYLFRDNELERMTNDHSWVEEQMRAGLLSPIEARQHPWRNVVTRALSGGEDPEVDVKEVALLPGDRLLLCSDGLSSVVTDERIEEIMRAQPVPTEACQALVDEANGAGGPDNVTTLILQIDAP